MAGGRPVAEGVEELRAGPNMPEITPGALKRLIAIDAALASPEGLSRPRMARRLRVAYKTVQRDHELLRAVTGDPGVYQKAADGTYWWWYSDHRRRVFARWLSRRKKPKRPK